MIDPDLLERATVLVRSGNSTRDEVLEQLLDYDDNEEDHLKVTDAAIAAQLADEENWGGETDVDRVYKAFALLEARGFIALGHAGYTQSDGQSDVSERYHELGRPADKVAYVFFHGQDVEGAINGRGLYLAFGPIAHDSQPEDGPRLGGMVRDAMIAQGFHVEWDGTIGQRPCLKPFEWRARFPRD